MTVVDSDGNEGRQSVTITVGQAGQTAPPSGLAAGLVEGVCLLLAAGAGMLAYP